VVVSAWSMGQLRDTTIEELFGEIFSVQSVLRCFKQDKYKYRV
jgi:hypothetical protein